MSERKKQAHRPPVKKETVRGKYHSPQIRAAFFINSWFDLNVRDCMGFSWGKSVVWRRLLSSDSKPCEERVPDKDRVK
jgi:hypothetical protein